MARKEFEANDVAADHDDPPARHFTTTTLALAGVLTATSLAFQQAPPSTAETGLLTSIRITESVLANGKPLPAGLYDLRLTNERPTPLPGQSADAERWVEFVANGIVVGRDVATVLRDDDLPAVGASSVPVRDGTRIDMLKAASSSVSR
jgi:hypothetical protein